MTSRPLRIVFMGSPAFAEPSLRALAATDHELALVVTQPDRPAGRGSKLTPPRIKLAAIELGLNVFQPETLKDVTARQRLVDARPDVFVVAAFGRILSSAVLAIPRIGSLNVHASLLPRWRGASPINAAILAGDSLSGVSIMEVVREMDAGPVVAQSETAILERDTAGSLEQRLAAMGAELLVDVLPAWASGERPARPQDPSLVTFCSLIKKDDGRLTRELTAVQAERAVRAYNPWPGAFIRYRNERLAIWGAHVDPPSAERPIGSMAVNGTLPAVVFDGGLLTLDEVQRQGGRRMSGRDFLNGERSRLEGEVVLA